MDLPTKLPIRLHPISAGYLSKIWDYRPPVGHTVEHLMHPEYFRHVLTTIGMKACDEVRCIAEDRSYYVQLFVEEVDKAGQWARLSILRTEWKDRQVEAGPDGDGWTVEFSGPHKWRVVSPAGVVAFKELETRDAAMKALAGLKTQRAA